MERSVVSRYGWVIALLAVGGLWLRMEGRQVTNLARAAPDPPVAEKYKPVSIAVVDVAIVFKNYDKFNKQLAEQKVAIEAFDQYVKKEFAALKEMGDGLQRLTAGSNEERELRLQLGIQTKSLSDEVALKKETLTNLEAQIYFDRYREVEAAARIVANERKIDFVFRLARDEMKRNDRNSVLQGVNRSVIVYPEKNDITDAIIKVLNQP